MELPEAAATAQAGEGRRRHRENTVRAGRWHRRWPAPPAREKACNPVLARAARARRAVAAGTKVLAVAVHGSAAKRLGRWQASRGTRTRLQRFESFDDPLVIPRQCRASGEGHG